MEEESIPVGGEPPACKPCVLQWPPLDVTSEGPQVNKFEQVSIVGHQMSVLRRRAGLGGPRSNVQGEAGTGVPVQRGIMGNGNMGNPLDRQNDRHTRLKTLTFGNSVGGW